MGNFDIHNWQANHLNKSTLNEESAQAITAQQVQKHLQSALATLEQYKQQNQIPSNESEFNDIEATLEEVITTLDLVK